MIRRNQFKIRQGPEEITRDPFHHALRPALFQGASIDRPVDEIASILLGHFTGRGRVFEPEYFSYEVVEYQVCAGGVNQINWRSRPRLTASKEDSVTTARLTAVDEIPLCECPPTKSQPAPGRFAEGTSGSYTSLEFANRHTRSQSSNSSNVSATMP